MQTQEVVFRPLQGPVRVGKESVFGESGEEAHRFQELAYRPVPLQVTDQDLLARLFHVFPELAEYPRPRAVHLGYPLHVEHAEGGPLHLALDPPDQVLCGPEKKRPLELVDDDLLSLIIQYLAVRKGADLVGAHPVTEVRPLHDRLSHPGHEQGR